MGANFFDHEWTRLAGKAQSSKFKVQSSRKASSPKLRFVGPASVIGISCLGLLWCLVFGVLSHGVYPWLIRFGCGSSARCQFVVRKLAQSEETIRFATVLSL